MNILTTVSANTSYAVTQYKIQFQYNEKTQVLSYTYHVQCFYTVFLAFTEVIQLVKKAHLNSAQICLGDHGTRRRQLDDWKKVRKMVTNMWTVWRISSLTSERLGLVCRHSAEVSQIALITDEHDDNVSVSVITQLSQPSFHVLVRQVLGNVVHQQRADSAAVVSAVQTAF